MKRSRIVFVLMILVVITFFLTGCERRERPWPSRAVTVVIPFAAGGDTDFNARAYVMRLGPILGQSIVAQNITGGGGTVGSTHVLNAAPDGYTVLFMHTTMSVNRAAGMSETTIDDFELVAIAAMGDFAVFVNTNSPFYTLDDLISATIAEPDTLLYSVLTGAVSHVTGILLNQAGAQFRIVDGGDTAMRNTSLMGGHVHAIPSAFGAVVPFIESGDFRPLAVVNNRRNSVFSDVPTTVELGFPNAILPMYYFFAFPRGTPRDIVERFADAVEQVYRMEDYRISISQAFHQEPFFVRGQEALNLFRTQQEQILLLAPYF